MLTPGAWGGLTEIVVVFEVAFVGLTQASFEVITQYTCAPVVSVVVEKVEALPDCITLFTNH